jgi:outer membrane lipoprotein SlyB
MNTTSTAALIVGFSLLIAVSGCARGLGGGDYSRRDARQAYRVQYGAVVATRPVTIEGEYTNLGTVGGGAVGYSLGRVIGDGDSSRVAGAVGGVAGAVAGREVEKAATTEAGLEITLDMDRGDTLVIVQSSDVGFRAGERVRVLFGGRNEARVVKTL